MGSGLMTGGFDGWRGPSLSGAQGNLGPQGASGSQGSQGATGVQGSQGGIGAQGFQGAVGQQGNTGSQGAQGSGGAVVVSDGADPVIAATTVGPTTTLTQTIVATWPQANKRYFACDTAAGNDANAGFSDVDQATAGTVAVKTLAKLFSIVPLIGMARSAQVAIKSGNYASDTTLALNHRGYTSLLVYATDTVATGGSTAFAGNTADYIVAGMTTATGMNAAGYNAIGGSTAQVLVVQLNGGGAPGFAASPARPYGCRIRFDSATTTIALRNFCSGVLLVPSSNTLNLSFLLPATPAAGDVFYIEMPNVTGPTLTSMSYFGTLGSGSATQIVGLSLGTLTATRSAFRVAGCEIGTFLAFDCTMFVTGQFVAGGVLQVGPVRSSFNNFQGGAITMADNCTISTTSFSIYQNLESLLWERSASAGGMVVYGEFSANGNNIITGIGTNSSTNHGGSCEIFGRAAAPPQAVGNCGLSINGGMTIGRVHFSNMGAAPCCQISGSGLGINIYGITGGIADGNTDVGVNMTPAGLSGNTTGAMGCTIALVGSPSATGTVGDVRLPGGQITSWASLLATGLADSEGNRFISVSGPLAHVSVAGSIVGAAGAVSSYFADGSIPVANITTAFRRPISARLMLRLRFNCLSNTSANTTTVTLYKNGVATAMQVSIPAGTTGKFVDSSHPILFVDGDDYDIRGDDAGDIGGLVTGSGTLEYAV